MIIQFAQKALIVQDGNVLLVRKSMDDPFNPGKWELPGGRLKDGESPDEALVREIREEVDLEIVPGNPLALWNWRLGKDIDSPMVIAVSRLCHVRSGTVSLERLEHDDFISEFGWFELGAVLSLDLIPDARRPIADSLTRLSSLST